MKPHLRALLLPAALVAGCGLYISDAEHLSRVDADLDGAPASADCDDGDAAAQVVADWFADGDGDGVGAGSPTSACNAPAGSVLAGGDCDDANADHSAVAPWYPDEDSDTWGAGAPVEGCGPPLGHVAEGGDCDDDDPLVHPGAVELCNLLDDDCDDVADDDALPTTWWIDADGDTFGDDATAVDTCDPPASGVLQGGDCDDDALLVNPDAVEVCNGHDDDCDELVDDADPSMAGLAAWYLDADGDLWGNGDLGAELSCTAPPDRVEQAGDCDDGDPEVHPGHDEVCDGQDNDCDLLADDDDPVLVGETFWADGDADGYGDPTAPLVACALPAGAAANPDDCDDGRDDASPAVGWEILVGQVGTCADGVDQDCDGAVDAADDDCGDVDGDGTLDAVDALYAFDCRGTGAETCLCARSHLLLPADWADEDAIHVVRGETCLIGCVPSPTDRLFVADTDALGVEDPGSWCWDFTGEPADTYVFRWVSAVSAADPTQPVDPLDCADWKKIDLSEACGVQDDAWCTRTDGLLTPHVDECDGGGAVDALSVVWNGSSL